MGKKEIVNMVPKILRDALASLGDENRQAIFIDLLIKDEVSYSNLLRELSFRDSSTLNYHLKPLLESGLISKIYEKRPGTRARSYYTPTEFGQSFFDKLMQVVEEPLERVSGTASLYDENFVPELVFDENNNQVVWAVISDKKDNHIVLNIGLDDTMQVKPIEASEYGKEVSPSTDRLTFTGTEYSKRFKGLSAIQSQSGTTTINESIPTELIQIENKPHEKERKKTVPRFSI